MKQMTQNQISPKVDLHDFSTELNGRILCGDGESVVDMPFLYEHILSGGSASQVFVSKEDCNTPEVVNFNKRFKKDAVDYKKSINQVSLDWDVPKKYKELDIEAYLVEKLKAEVAEFDFIDAKIEERYYRLKMEYRIWKKRNLIDMLRTLIYIVNTFEEHKIIWGTGRGSSCASYILYLVGLHQVDSVEYELDIGEFFR